MASLKNVIYLSNEDYETLVSTGTVTIDGDTLTYDENNVYVTPDKLASTTEDGLMSSNDKAKLDSLPTFGTSASKDFTTSVTSGSGDLVTSGAVYTAIDNLPEPMVYKGTLGTGGTIADLPTASSTNEGFTYKVITSGTYASQSAKVGDVFISDGSEWTLVPSGDDIEDTWRQINVNGTQLLGTGISTGPVNFKNGSNITISGSGHDITISASQPIVNSGILTIQRNGTNVQTFTANQSNNVTANITVPTKLKELSERYTSDLSEPTNSYNNPTLTFRPFIYDTAGNRMYGINYKRVIVEESIDAGKTWTVRSLTEVQKNQLFDNSNGGGQAFPKVNDKHSCSAMIRVTCSLANFGSEADDATDANKLALWTSENYKSATFYCNCDRFYVYVGGPNFCDCWVQTAPAPTSGTEPVFTNQLKIDLARGWDGGNTASKTNPFVLGGSKTQAPIIRFIFRVNSGDGQYDDSKLNQSSSPLLIKNIRLLGNTIWGSSNYMMKFNTPYANISGYPFLFDWYGSLRPSATSAYNLGANDRKWNQIHGVTFYENGASLADKYLGKTAKANDADKLDGQDSSYYLNYNNLANKPTIPTKTSELTNDRGFITSSYHDATKQDVINDLDDIRSGSALGATSVQPSEISNMVTTNTDQTIISDKTIAYGNKTNYTLNNGNTFDLSGNQYNYLQIGYNGAGMYSFGTSQFFPNSNDSRDLGTSGLKWRDLYLSGTAYTNNVKTNGTYLALQGVDGALTLGGKAAQFNVPIVPTGTTQSIGASERLWKDLYLSGNLTDGTNSISVANIASKSDIPTKTSDLTNDSGFLTSESDTLGAVLNRGNSATTDIDLNNKDFFNAGTQKTTYIYSASQTPNTQYYWFKITPPPSNASDRYFLCSESDVNYPRERGMFILDISNYSNGASYNVSLNNIGSTNYNDTLHLLNVAVDASGNVYVQCRATWASYLRFIRHNSNSTTQSYPSVGQAAFGTVAGFTSLKMISDTGCIRILNGELDTNTTRTGHTQLFVDALIEGGTSLSNKYLGKTAKANDSDKLDGHDSSYFYQASNPNGYTSNSGTITGISVNGVSIATSGVANLATNGTYNASTNKIATMSDIPSLTDYVTTNTTQTITGIKTFGESAILATYSDIKGFYNQGTQKYPSLVDFSSIVFTATNRITLAPSDATADRTLTLPDKSGTIALTTDVHGIEVIDLR